MEDEGDTRLATTIDEDEDQDSNKVGRPYDIDTLIELGKTTKISRRALKFSEEAPPGILFPTDTFASIQPEMTRHRGLSQTSQVTYTSEDDNDEIMFKGGLRLPKLEPLVLPSRQPYGPPKNTLVQVHKGFARFLKEHASPSHNRVTAGGRIVPAGPKSPPPTYRMEFIDRLIKLDEDSKKTIATRNGYTTQRANQVETVKNIFDSEMTECITQANTRDFSDNGSDKVQDNMNIHKTKIADKASNGIPDNSRERLSSAATRGNSAPVLQLPPDAELIMMLPDGSAVIRHGNAMVRAALHGAHTFLEPLPQVQGFPSQAPSNVQPIAPLQTVQACSYQTIPAPQQIMPFQPINPFNPTTSLQQISLDQHAYSQASVAGMQYSSMPITPNVETMFPATQGLFPVTSMPDGFPDYHIQQDYRTQIDSLSAQQQFLQTQLISLEKFVALNSHDLQPWQLSLTSAQRKHLIEQLDCIRKSKKHFAAQMHTAAQAFGNPEGIVETQAIYPHMGPAGFTQTSSTFHDFSKSTNGSRKNHKKVNNSETHETKDDVQVKSTYTRDDGQAIIGRKPTNFNKLSPNAPAFIPSDGVTCLNQKQYRSGLDHLTGGVEVGRQHNLNSIADSHAQAKPSKPYKPVVLPEEATYCDEMGYNNPKAPKMYCSLVTEFVEAIKAAREHAKRYGCKGGQSKDPSWDAEQDIRFAMQGKMPILLPLLTPQYILMPRPWCWEESDFNVCRGRDASWRPERYVRQLGEAQCEPLSDRWNDRIMRESTANSWTIGGHRGNWNDDTLSGSFNSAGTQNLSCVNQTGTDSSGCRWTPPTSSSRLFGEFPPNQQRSDVQGCGLTRTDSFGSDPQLSPGECARLNQEHEELVLQGYFPPPVSEEETKDWAPEVTAKIDARLERVAPNVKHGASATRSMALHDTSIQYAERKYLRDLHDESPNPLKEKWDVGRIRNRSNGSQSFVVESNHSESPSPKPAKEPWPLSSRQGKQRTEAKHRQNTIDSNATPKPIHAPRPNAIRVNVESNAKYGPKNIAKNGLLEPVKRSWVKPYLQGLTPEKIKSVLVESPSDDEKSKQFLRSMLKTPDMNWSPQSKASSKQHYNHSDNGYPQQSGHSVGPGTHMRENQPFEDKAILTGQYEERHKPNIHKSRSSVASPTFHARGVLPRAGDPAISYLASTAKASTSHTKQSPSHRRVENNTFASPNARSNAVYRDLSRIGYVSGTSSAHPAFTNDFVGNQGRARYQRAPAPVPRQHNESIFLNLKAQEREHIARSRLYQL